MGRIACSSFTLSLALLAGASGAHAATFTVNSTAHTADAVPGDGTCADAAGACTFRAAIQEANAHPNGAEPDRIHFSIPGPGPHIIRPPSILPAITDPVIIDGYTQTGAVVNTDSLATNAVLQIELDGSEIPSFTTKYGLELDTDDSVIRGLAVHGFFTNVRIPGSRNVVEGCFIGTDLSGLAGDPLQGTGVLVGGNGISANDNLIGGDAPRARNLISGNPVIGVSIFHFTSTGNRIWGNLIGTDRTGLAPLPNTELLLLAGNAPGGPGAAVKIDCCENHVGGPGAGQGNVISGNASFGIFAGSDNRIEGNRVGVAINDAPLPNGLGGARAAGGTWRRNVVAHNRGAGFIVPWHAEEVRITENSIFGNEELGIDLSNLRCSEPFAAIRPCPDGVLINDSLDADAGSNLGQNYPVLTTAHPVGADLVLAGTLHSTPDSSFRIELFATSECDPSGHGEGERFVGSTGVFTDAAGDASFFAVANSVAVTAGEYLTATAIDRDGNTSEFSACLVINAPPEARCQDATARADASCVAFASIDDGSFDPDGGFISRTQDPAAPYALGTTNVTLTVRDVFGAEDRCVAPVTVVDETAPSILCPGDLTVPATSTAGAEVSFAPTATDNCSVASVVCAPAAGSTFAIGTTTTTCTATDGSRNPAACSFEVHVQGAAEQLADLIAEIGTLGLNSGLENSLRTKLQSALEAVAAGNASAACQRLQTFESEIASLISEGQLGMPAGSALVADSLRIRSVLGCP